MTRGPSLYAEPLLNKSPDPHSVVERLLTRAQSRCDKDRALGDSSIMTPENYLEWQAATIISKLQAEVERDKLYWNGRCVDLQVNAHGWMNAHDQLLGFIQSRPELLKALIDEKFAIKYPSPADVPEILQRALAAESSLSRIQSETVELRQNYVDANEGRLDAIALLTRVHQLGATSAWRRMPDGSSFNATPLGQDIASAIRSSLTDVGEAKTAESNHSPSTQNTETE